MGIYVYLIYFLRCYWQFPTKDTDIREQIQLFNQNSVRRGCGPGLGGAGVGVGFSQCRESRDFGIVHSHVTWASYLIFLSISFLLCKAESIPIVPLSHDYWMNSSVFEVFDNSLIK